MSDRRIMIMELTHTAKSILSEFQSKYKQGELSEKMAKSEALRIIRDLRYGPEKKDYFWISDRTPVMIMHPYRTELNGKGLGEFKDPNGKRLFVEFARVVAEKGEGYVDYIWQWKDDSKKLVPKLSYVTLFKPWNWIIGTGIYLEDVRAEIETLESNLRWISFGIIGIVSLLLFIVTRQSMKIEKNRREAEDDLRENVNKYRRLLENNHMIKIVDDSALMLSNLYDQKERNQLACKLYHRKVEPIEITRIFSSLADSTVRYVIDQTIKELGEPPEEFVFIVFGSQGRREQTLETDQDNAIIFDDVDENNFEIVEKYFLKLGKIVCNKLQKAGYKLCTGNNMASNPHWCKPISEWKKTLNKWITESSAQTLLEINIFFDFRPVYGDKVLSSELSVHMNNLIENNIGFSTQLIETILLSKIPEDIFGGIIVGDDENAPKSFDIKNVMKMIVEFARIYAITNIISSRNTIERLEHVFKLGKLELEEYNGIVNSYNALMKIRMKKQLFQINEGMKTSNMIDPRLIEVDDYNDLKESFKVIKLLQKKIGFLNKLHLS